MPYLQMETTSQTTLHAAHEWVFANLREGTLCPCCNQVAKVSKTPLSAAMAMTLLVLIDREDREETTCIHCEEYLTRHHPDLSRQHCVGKLCHWNLLLSVDGPLYCVTDRGREFARGQRSVPAYGWTYNQHFVMDPGAPLVFLRDVLRPTAPEPGGDRARLLTGNFRQRRR